MTSRRRAAPRHVASRRVSPRSREVHRPTPKLSLKLSRSRAGRQTYRVTARRCLKYELLLSQRAASPLPRPSLPLPLPLTCSPVSIAPLSVRGAYPLSPPLLPASPGTVSFLVLGRRKMRCARRQRLPPRRQRAAEERAAPRRSDALRARRVAVIWVSNEVFIAHVKESFLRWYNPGGREREGERTYIWR